MWKWIVQDSSLFWNFGFVDPGGGWVSFWHDFWVPGVRLFSAFPRIAASAQSLDLLLLTCVGNDGRIRYEFPLRFQLRGGALAEWHDFLTFLHNRPVPTISMGPARVVWPLHTTFSFTVASFMAILRRRWFTGMRDFPHRCIWMIEVPTKVQCFMWLLFYGRILTLDNLQRRGLIAPNWCVLCRRNAESVSHIFLSCSFAKRIWRWFSLMLSIFGPFHYQMHHVITGWNFMNCASEFTPVKRVFLHSLCWNIWLERNNRVFRDVDNSEFQVARKIAFAVGSWLKAAGIFSNVQMSCWLNRCTFAREPD
ncbi:hypothetical protein LINGRAHAP2_LOCUS482 [Linum grandiflorum]